MRNMRRRGPLKFYINKNLQKFKMYKLEKLDNDII